MERWICVICGFIYDGEGSRFGAALNGSAGGTERPAIHGRAGVDQALTPYRRTLAMDGVRS